MRWLLLWAVASVPTALLVGRALAGPQPGLTRGDDRRDNGRMTTSATIQPANHRGHGCPDDPTFDPAAQVFTCVSCGERERAGLHDGTGRCEGCQDEAAARTPQVIRLEIALAKAHYYDSTTFEEANTRHDALVALETELEAQETGCEAAADLRDPGDRWGADEDDHDTQPDPDRYES